MAAGHVGNGENGGHLKNSLVVHVFMRVRYGV
jgi:hypothetical protein